MSIVATARNSKHLADTAEGTHLELGGNDVLLGPAEVRPGPNGRVASNALTKRAQGRHLFDVPSKTSPSSNGANFSETDLSGSRYLERRWRWPLSYRSIEVLAIFVDTLIIVAAGVLADAAYGLMITALPTEITIYGGAAALVAALVTCVLKERGLYKPTALLNWTAQVRAVIITWIGVFMFLGACVFALKIGSTFSRITIISFVAGGLCGLIAQRVFWRTILEDGLANGKLSGRTIVLISDRRTSSSEPQGGGPQQGASAPDTAGGRGIPVPSVIELRGAFCTVERAAKMPVPGFLFGGLRCRRGGCSFTPPRRPFQASI